VTFYPLTETAQAPTNTRPHHHCVLGCPLRRRLSQRPSCKSGLALSRERHSSRRHTQSPSPILEQSGSNSDLIGLTLLLVKAVIGPSLRKTSLRTGALPQNGTQSMSGDWSFKLTVVEFVGLCINMWMSMCL